MTIFKPTQTTSTKSLHSPLLLLSRRIQSFSRCSQPFQRHLPNSCLEPKKTAILFPGQGSQFVGMGKEFNEQCSSAREVFEEVDEALGYKLSALMFEGDQSSLNQTENAQPAILAASIASLRFLQKEFGFDIKQQASFALGHSLGEYTALVATESISLTDAIKIVHCRGSAMQECVKNHPKKTVMSALVLKKGGLREIHDGMTTVKELLPQGEIVELANINSSFQVVLSGTLEGVNIASRFFKDRRIALRAVDLPVSAPFHCSIMAPACQAVEAAFEGVKIKAPITPVVFNAINGTLHSGVTDPADLIRSYVLQQIDHTVPWFNSIQFCKQSGVQRFLIFGPNKVLGNLVRKDFPLDCVRFLTTLDECRGEFQADDATSEESTKSSESQPRLDATQSTLTA